MSPLRSLLELLSPQPGRVLSDQNELNYQSVKATLTQYTNTHANQHPEYKFTGMLMCAEIGNRGCMKRAPLAET
jgi:hypothetical protein